jgi:Ca2+-binding EF-hand superfamily protein
MHLGYVEYVVTGQAPEVKPDSGKGNRQERLFRRLDVDGDGFITRAEVRKRMPGDQPAATTTFDRLDRNKDDKIDPEELSRL